MDQVVSKINIMAHIGHNLKYYFLKIKPYFFQRVTKPPPFKTTRYAQYTADIS